MQKLPNSISVLNNQRAHKVRFCSKQNQLKLLFSYLKTGLERCITGSEIKNTISSSTGPRFNPQYIEANICYSSLKGPNVFFWLLQAPTPRQNTHNAKAEAPVSSQASLINRVPGQPGLCRHPLSGKTNKQQKNDTPPQKKLVVN